MDQIKVLAFASTSEKPENTAIAASRAHATGCLPVGSEAELTALPKRLGFVSKYAEGRPVALLISNLSPEEFSNSRALSDHENWELIIAAEEACRIQEWARWFDEKDWPFSAQVTGCDQALKAVELGAKSIILKGSESGGFVGGETAFVLAQHWAKTAKEHNLEVPFLVQGGIGPDTASAVVAAGASGIVLDSQLLLARESIIDSATRKWIESSDGSEVSTLGAGLGLSFNWFHRRNSEAFAKLNELEKGSVAPNEWVAANLSTSAPDCLPFGQDICLAKALAENFVTVGGIITGIRTRIEENLAAAVTQKHLAEDSDFARSHGLKYPVLQGPMTRVSDTADFADAVATNGGLPFLALAVMRKAEVKKLLEESAERLKDKSWGVGILGFLPAAIRAEQSEEILKHKPPFAIIAGGRPDQAKEFEDEGIATYLHVPSPGLLQNFLRQGAKRFIFEGRECGGHVGPRSSFVLWQSVCDIVLEQLEKKPVKDLHLVFAGGIHDDVSASMIAAMTAPLAERGVKIGLLMGTAYLFTKEAVESGAIVSRFQKEAVECEDTVLLQTGPGHAIRCIKTPYYQVFEEEKNKLLKNGATHDDLVRHLEGMNIGRLRVASKGVDRKKTDKSATRELVEVDEKEQFDRGMYMIGQVAALEDGVMTMAELHDKLCNGGVKRLESIAGKPKTAEVISEQKPSEIAIIGMSCFYPDASGLDEFWQNILDRHYAVREIPKSHWDWRLFYDEDPRKKDRIVSKWGGFVKDIKFDPLKYGITPKSMEVIEPLQLLSLEAVYHALGDAGYLKRPFNREKTACIVGIGGGAGPKSVAYGFRTCMRLADYFADMPILSDEIIERAGDVLPDWTEDSFPGFLSNICSGRVANRFDFGGANYAIDAACASSMASLDACVRELECGNADMAIAMGADAVQTPFSYMAFSKTHALSQKGHSRPFDAEGDGIVLSEGVGVVVLKRLEDAKRDGDKIYAVISGIGASSDGKAKGLTAPNAVGQARALDRAYEKANISPKEVGLIEAHGTGTVVGDQTESTALSNVLRDAGADVQSTALGSVKSMIGHTKCAAGIAGIIKTALALHHKVLPPTLVNKPNPSAKFDESSLYLNTTLRPWIQQQDRPRTAGVSAFGFGGTNFHTVLQEYKDDYTGESVSASRHWPTELFIWSGEKSDILAQLSKLTEALGKDPQSVDFPSLSAAVNRSLAKGSATLVIIAGDQSDLLKKIEAAVAKIGKEKSFDDPRGIIFSSESKEINKVAFLFPGQGSQYPDMLADLAVTFPRIRESLDLADSIVGDRIPKSLGRYIYPPSAFDEDQKRQHAKQLSDTQIAQPALGACAAGMIRLLADFGIKGEAFAGHSYGEYVALYAAGVLTEEQLYEISYLRGSAIKKNLESGSAMLAVNADADVVREKISKEKDVYLANINSPAQTVLSMTEEQLPKIEALFEKCDITTKRLPVACGFHAPFVEKAAKALEKELVSVEFAQPGADVYSNSTAKVYPADSRAQKDLLRDHLTSTVDYRGMIQSMAKDGVDLFIEVGPGSVLSTLSRENTEGFSCDVLSTDQKGRNGITHLQNLLGRLVALGMDIDIDRLSRVRRLEEKSLDSVLNPTVEIDKPNMWQVNGVRAKMIAKEEPLLLGQPHPKLEKTGRTEEILAFQPAKKPAPTKEAPPAKTAVESSFAATKPKNLKQSRTEKMGSQNQPPISQTTSRNGHPTLNGISTGGSDQVMMGFQNLMSQFLETQKSVMMSYLNGGPVPMPNGSSPSLPSQPVQLPTALNGSANGHGYSDLSISEVKHVAQPAPVVNGDRQPGANGHAVTPDVVAHKAANGSVATNRVENLEPIAKVEEKTKAEPAAEPSESISIDQIKKHLLEIVGERTGYPEDMLDLELDLEGDLGIDSIKRVEILGELAEFIMPNSTNMEEDSEDGLDLEKLSGLRTLQQILDYLEEFLESQETVETADSKKKLNL